MDSRRMMETDEEAYVFEGDDIMEPYEEDEEEVEQLEEMRPPVLTSWMGPDGITVDGIMCVDDGIIRLKNRCQLDNCSICYKPSTAHGKHQICCLPCGHMYGLSCIKKWLLQSSSTRKCPQCNTSCSFEDAILLYPPPLCVTDHQKASSSVAFFPFTKLGFREFKKYESSRTHDVLMLQAHDIRHMNLLLTRAHKLEELSSDSLQTLKPRIDALKQLASALRRRIDAFGQRNHAFESRVIFYLQMYKKHHKKKCLANRAAAKAKNKGENEAEVAARKKLKDNEKKDEKTMQASATVDVPEEEMVEDVAEEPEEEEKVEVKAKPTTKTTDHVHVRSRSNRGTGLHSISKVILKRKKSNNYMYYYAVGAAAALTVPLAVGYTLYS